MHGSPTAMLTYGHERLRIENGAKNSLEGEHLSMSSKI